MGNGEQYIWKPPEEDDIITLHPPPLHGDSVQGHPSPPTAKEVVYMHVCVFVRDYRQTDRPLICDCCVYRSGRPFDLARRHNTAAL